MTLWKYYIYDVRATKFQMLDQLILARNKDLSDVLQGHPRQGILNRVSLSQNTFPTLGYEKGKKHH